MVNCKFKIGDNVRITGKVVSVGADSIGVKISGEPFIWSIYGHNAKVIKPRKKEEKPEKPKYYTGKVVCVESDYPYDFTVGKVYTFEDGVVKDNRGASRYVGHKIKDLSEIKKIWKFIPFVEDVEKPLTTEEIKAMDGQKVWLISLTNDKLPHIHDTLGGWHKVDAKNNKLLDEDEAFFYIDDNDTPFGFIAYRTAPSK